MIRFLQKWLPLATLACWSAVLLYFFFSGRVQHFLAPAFRPWVLVAGVVLAIMAVALVFSAERESSCCTGDGCGHSMSRFSLGKLLTFAVLLLPMSLSAVASKDSFSKVAIENRGVDVEGKSLPARKSGSPERVEMPLPTKDEPAVASGAEPAKPAATTQSDASKGAAPADTADYLQRTPEGAIIADVTDLLYAAQDNSLRKDFEGKPVQLVAQLLPDKSSVAGGRPRFKAVRMFMTCCAADARPVATLVEAEHLPDLPEMTWIKVVGTSTFPLENGRRVAVIQATRVEKSPPPEESLLY